MSRPSVVILCPKEFRFTDLDATVERPFLADITNLSTVWLEYNSPFPAAVIDAHAQFLCENRPRRRHRPAGVEPGELARERAKDEVTGNK